MIIALVDDNTAERDHAFPLLLQTFQNFGIPLHRFDFFSNGTDFLNNWQLGKYDLIILDILMGEDLTGVDIAREIRKKNKDVRIVFCSSSNEYANESYDVNASYYIQKPVTAEGITQMIQRLDVADFEMRRFIVLPDGQRLILRNMIYAEYSNHLITIHMKKGEDIKIWLALGQFVDLLKPYNFLLHCNKGTIVNLYEVSDWSNSTFTMSDDSCISVSRRKKNEIDQAYHDFQFANMRKGF